MFLDSKQLLSVLWSKEHLENATIWVKKILLFCSIMNFLHFVLPVTEGPGNWAVGWVPWLWFSPDVAPDQEKPISSAPTSVFPSLKPEPAKSFN